MILTEKKVMFETDTHIIYDWYLQPKDWVSCGHSDKHFTSNRWQNEEGNYVTDLHCAKCNFTYFRETKDKRK